LDHVIRSSDHIRIVVAIISYRPIYSCWAWKLGTASFENSQQATVIYISAAHVCWFQRRRNGVLQIAKERIFSEVCYCFMNETQLNC